MFSPEASTLSLRSSQRNPRRRPRNSTEPQQQQPRRKRNKLGDDAFVALGDDTIDDDVNGSIGNGHARHTGANSSLKLLDMPVRDKKSTAKRMFQEDIALYLNKNENYSVKRLPSFPAALAGGPTPFRASALPVAGLALALTSDEALVWTYANTTSTSNKIISLPLPPALKSTEPLPLGGIVRNGPTNDFGVVAVASSSGKIIFWENIDSAEARSLFAQRKQGIEGSVKLYSGERVIQLVDIDHAGYIIVLSSGRLAHLTLRDAQGRPNINTTILNTPNGSSGSFFSLKGLLGGAFRKTIASVKARPSESRGQMEVIAATRNGLFQFWDLSWSGQQVFKYETDTRETILHQVQSGSPPEIRGQQDVQVLDFAILGRSQEHGDTNLLVLVAISHPRRLEHFLLEVDITEEGSIVSRAIALRMYIVTERPKEPSGTLLLPDPGHTAFVHLPGAIIVASLAKPEESPEAQLFSDSGTTPLPFQDCIYFKSSAHVRIVGQALEPAGRKNQTCSALIFVQDFGILQLSAYAPPSAGERSERGRNTAKTKLMQATFFSTVPGTIIDFNVKGRMLFNQKEVEYAAFDISDGVLSSSFEQLEGNSLLLEDHLHKRAVALKTLNKYLRSQFPDLSFLGRWYLLWHAEKLAAATKLWGWYQTQLLKREKHPELYPEPNTMVDIVRALGDKWKSPVGTVPGEHDQIRLYFLKDINSLEKLIPWTWNYLRLAYVPPEHPKPLPAVMPRLHEADEIMLTVLETAYSFRKEHVDEYGLDPESLDIDGVLKPGQGYDKFPNSPWTATHNFVSSLRSIVDLGRKYADDCYEKHEEEAIAQEVAQHNPRLVRLNCQNHIERSRWGLDQSDGQHRAMGEKLRDEWNTNVRPKQIYYLAGMGLATEGMNIAERYQDMVTLVDLIWEESQYLDEAKQENHSKMVETEINLKLARIKDRVKYCFKRYQDDFANAYFSKYINSDSSGILFEKAHEEQDDDFQTSLTKFLNADKSRARLGWINNICGEKEYGSAAQDLENAASQERNIWCSTVELSIAKLAIMAEEEAGTQEAETTDPEKLPNHKAYQTKLDNQLQVANIQKQLYKHVLPVIIEAMDDESAVQLLMAEYGQGRLVERPALQLLLQQGFDQLVQHRVMDPYLLIDVLTLMTSNRPEDLAARDSFNQFTLALKVLALSEIEHPTITKGLPNLIWKRVLLEDDWTEINATQSFSGDAMADYLGATIAGATLKALVELMSKDDMFLKVTPSRVRDMYGAGCTDGEFAVRFAEEDLRRPLIQDNLSDELVLKDLVDNHRLEEWFDAAMAAGSLLAIENDEHREARRRRAANASNVGGGFVRPNGQPASEAVEPIAASVEPAVGGLEQVERQVVDEDVDMQGS